MLCLEIQQSKFMLEIIITVAICSIKELVKEIVKQKILLSGHTFITKIITKSPENNMPIQ